MGPISKNYQDWFSWLMAAHNKHDSRIRFAVSMRVLKDKSLLHGRMYCRGHFNKDEATRFIISEPLKDILPPRISEIYPLLSIPKIVVDELFKYDNDDTRYTCVIKMWVRFCSWFAILVLIPFVVLSIIYNVLYPILSISLNGGSRNGVEGVLTSIYLAQLCLILIFTPKTIEYRQLMKKVHLTEAYLRSGLMYSRIDIVKVLKRSYYGYLTDEVKAQLLISFFRQDIGVLILEMVGEYSEVDVSLEEEKKLYFPVNIELYLDDTSIYDFWGEDDLSILDFRRPHQVNEIPKVKIFGSVDLSEQRAVEIITSAKQKIGELGMVGMVREVSQSIGSASIVSLARENSGHSALNQI